MNACGVIGTFGVVVLTLAANVSGSGDSEFSRIHNEMTDVEIANIFHTTRDNVPPYVVVPVFHDRYKRENKRLRLQFSAYGREINNHLNPVDDQLIGTDTPVWLAFTNSNGTVEYEKMAKGIMERTTAKFFTNKQNTTIVRVHNIDGTTPSFIGLVDDLLIYPVPRRFLRGKSRRHVEAPEASRTLLDSHDHVIIKLTSVAEQEKKIREASRSNNSSGTSRVKRSDRKIIYPSLLVQTSFDQLHPNHNEADFYHEIMYQIAFWKAVDLRFRKFDNPKVRIRIAGIIIGLDRNAILGKPVNDKTDALVQMQKHWYEMNKHADFPHEAYDIVMTMTNSKIVAVDDTRTAIAEKSFCKPPQNQTYRAVGIFTDNRGFSGILQATYSLVSIFGISPTTVSGGSCDLSEESIMQPNADVGTTYRDWSPCSVESISIGLKERYVNCADEPARFHSRGTPLSAPLPGDVLSIDLQCDGRGYQFGCESAADVCADLECYTVGLDGFVKGFGCHSTGPAAEGTRCGSGSKCLRGRCRCVTAECLLCKG